METHKYSRVNTCYYYFALFYTSYTTFFSCLLCLRTLSSLPPWCANSLPPLPRPSIENPFSIFPNFFVIYTCENICGIIFNFSIIKYASEYTHIDGAYHLSTRVSDENEKKNANKDSFLLWLCFLRWYN